MIKCPCCENESSFEEWYKMSSDYFYICPVCNNTCEKEEIENVIN